MKRALIAWVFGAVAGISIADRTAAQSFDCQKAQTDSEIAICGDAQLAKLDEDLATLYESITVSLPAGDRGLPELRDAQRRWIRDARTCGADVTCLRASYEGRIFELSTTWSKSRASATPQDGPPPLGEQQAPPVEVASVPAEPPPSAPEESALAGQVPNAADSAQNLNVSGTPKAERHAPSWTEVPMSDTQALLFLGGMGTLVACAWGAGTLLWTGVKCPSCRRRRTSDLVSRELLSQHVTTELQMARSTTEHREFGRATPTRISETAYQVPVTRTVDEYMLTYRCRKCGCMFDMNSQNGSLGRAILREIGKGALRGLSR
jgi:uncharacterized protein